MKDAGLDLNQRIAERVRDLRTRRQLSLDGLARVSGVSRSMISLIERGETSPTAVVLEKLATGLGVMLATLFDAGPGGTPVAACAVSRYDEQSHWRDPGSGYVRRNVTPPNVSQPMQIVDVSFPAGGRVAFESGPRQARVCQQVWMLDGAMDITYGAERHHLERGDCFAMTVDRPIVFHNPTRRASRYAVVIAADAGLDR